MGHPVCLPIQPFLGPTVRTFSSLNLVFTYKSSHCCLNCVAKRFDEEKVTLILLYNSPRYFHTAVARTGEMPPSYNQNVKHEINNINSTFFSELSTYKVFVVNTIKNFFIFFFYRTFNNSNLEHRFIYIIIEIFTHNISLVIGI